MGFKEPKDIAKNICDIGERKSSHNFLNLIILSILAGAYIGFGAQLMISVTYDAAKVIGMGLARFIGGSVFSLGLILVIMAGTELFTGNSLMTISLFERKISISALVRNWTTVYLGNFIGAVLVVILVFYSGIWKVGNNAPGLYTLNIAVGKVQLDFITALVRGIGANLLVCMAVWLALSGERTIDKIIGIYFPIMAFATLGLEHSIANMFFLPLGILLKSAGLVVPGVSNLTLLTMITKNLIPVTIGNIIGGVLFVAAPYWFVYIRNRHQTNNNGKLIRLPFSKVNRSN